MKRVLSILLLFYLLFTAFHPCAGEVRCALTEDHSDTQRDDEDCTPCCICICCGTPLIFQEMLALVIFINETPKFHFLYIPFFGRSFNPSFWQPPRTPAFTLKSYNSL